MVKKIVGLAVLITLWSGMPVAKAAIIDVYENRQSWEDAVSSFVLEDFSDTDLVPGLNFTSTNGYIADGRFNDLLTTDNQVKTTWIFTQPAYAFGQDWNLRPGSIATPYIGIRVYADELLVEDIPSTLPTNNFWGFVSSITFNRVELIGGIETDVSNPTTQPYTSDNLVFATYSDNGNGDNGNGDNNVIPEPSAMVVWSILAGVVGLTVSWRRRKRA